MASRQSANSPVLSALCPHRIRVTRYSLVTAIASVAIFCTSGSPLHGQVTPQAPSQSEIDSGQYTFSGLVNANGTLVRSGPSESDYPTLRLEQGTRLTVVGMRFDWLKVLPPDGSFCLVPQAFVEKRGDGKVGRVVNNAATVRIGSDIVPAKHKVPMRLEPGTDVIITGELDEFYKIEPPSGVFLYVDKRFVDPVQRVGEPAGDVSPSAISTGNSTPKVMSQPSNAQPLTVDATSTSLTSSSEITKPAADVVRPSGDRFVVSSDPAVPGKSVPSSAVEPASEPAVAGPLPATDSPSQASPEVTDSKPVDSRTVAATDSQVTPVLQAPTLAAASTDAAPTTRPSVSVRDLQDRLSRIEDRYIASNNGELSIDPIDGLLTDYELLLTEPNLPPNAEQVVEFRVRALQIRREALLQFAETKKFQEQIRSKQQDLVAEQAELETRHAETAVTRFAAVGKLSMSSLQFGNQTMYRLVDPASSRTIVYLRTNDPATSSLLDKFVGVHGVVSRDQVNKLAYIAPKSLEAVDPSQVNVKIFAELTPPSLATQGATTATEE